MTKMFYKHMFKPHWIPIVKKTKKPSAQKIRTPRYYSRREARQWSYLLYILTVCSTKLFLIGPLIFTHGMNFFNIVPMLWYFVSVSIMLYGYINRSSELSHFGVANAYMAVIVAFFLPNSFDLKTHEGQPVPFTEAIFKRYCAVEKVAEHLVSENIALHLFIIFAIALFDYLVFRVVKLFATPGMVPSFKILGKEHIQLETA